MILFAVRLRNHRPRGEKLKALAFCKNVSHAIRMQQALGERYHTRYLTGKNSVGERLRAYRDLQDEQTDLEILCTIGILNEGVDIPGVNMVLFLRPTESSTIFIQQLGRGLRRYEGKKYVTVLDFIGKDYRRSMQIAFALGSLSQNFVVEERLVAELVKTDFSSLGLDKYDVEIHMDALSKEEILDSIEHENLNRMLYVRQDYQNFKKYIGAESYPRHVDYLNTDYAPDLLHFMQIRIGRRKAGSYYGFLKGIEEESSPSFDDAQADFIRYVSGMLPLVRDTEFLIFRCLIEEKIAEVPYVDKLLEIRGVGLKTVIGFVAEVGDIKRFDDPKQLQKLAGYAIVRSQSGKHKGESHISYRGRKRLRYVLYEAAVSVVGHSPEFRSIHRYYTTRDKNPLKKMQSLIAVACKLIRVFYLILQTGATYNAEKMMEDIRRPAAV